MNVNIYQWPQINQYCGAVSLTAAAGAAAASPSIDSCKNRSRYLFWASFRQWKLPFASLTIFRKCARSNVDAVTYVYPNVCIIYFAKWLIIWGKILINFQALQSYIFICGDSEEWQLLCRCGPSEWFTKINPHTRTTTVIAASQKRQSNEDNNTPRYHLGWRTAHA